MPLLVTPYDEMTAADYAEIGLRCGLEIHRQLLTRTKLFCRCPAGKYSDDYHAEILRHMRPTLSELGEYDGTALMEKKTRKNIYYRIHRDTVCTYEFDDTPPFFMAEDALDAALEMAFLLRLNQVSELHIARKQYLDGSIPTGFQRTTVLGVDGWIPYGDRKIGIRQLGLEEDACREVSDVGHDRVYLTDRLGMPLIEIVTEPDMQTPQEAAEVATILRRLCRSTGRIRTGYGAVRQDVNVSITGGTRVEIKGVPQIGRIPRLIYNEARRQSALLHIRDELKKRGVTPDSLGYSVEDVTSVVSKSLYEPLRAAMAKGHCVKCVALRRFAGLLNEQTQEETTFAKEFSDRIRVIACLTQLPNMVYSDAASETLYGRDWQRLRKKMSAGQDDALLLVWGDEADTQTATAEIVLRAREAATGIPSDTRQALKDGTTGFERVLPGADRMYPDTDLPPMAIPEERAERIRENVPTFVWDRDRQLLKAGLPADIVEVMSASPYFGLFCDLTKNQAVTPTFAAVVLCQRIKALRRAGWDPAGLSDDDISDVFRAYAEGQLAREGVVDVLRGLLDRRSRNPNTKITVADVIAALELHPASDDKVAGFLGSAVDAMDRRLFATREQMHRHLMGVLMKRLRGRFDGGNLSRMLSERLRACCNQQTSVQGEA